MRAEFDGIASELRTVFESSEGRLSETDFSAIALRSFAFQFTSNPVYAAPQVGFEILDGR